IAAIQAYALRLTTGGDNFLNRRPHVIGIHEQSRLFGKNIQKIVEGFRFIIVRHDPGVRLCAIDRNLESGTGIHIGCSFASSNKSRTRSENTCLDSVGPARTEFDDRVAGSRARDPCRFARDQCLQMYGGQKTGLHQLRFRDGSSDAKNRLSWEKDGSFGQCPDIAGEMEALKVVKELLAHVRKERQRLEIPDFFFGKADVLQEVKRLFESGSDKIVATRWKMTHKQFEGGASGKLLLHVGRSHRQFVQVGQEA